MVMVMVIHFPNVVKPVNMVVVLLVFEAVVGKGSATEDHESQREK